MNYIQQRRYQMFPCLNAIMRKSNTRQNHGRSQEKSSYNLFVLRVNCFFTHSFFVTNLKDAFTPETIVRSYQKRGTMENYIKEAKNGFYLDKMNSHSFQVNEVKMMLSLLAYNLTNWLRTLCFPKGRKSMQIETIRTRIIKVASKLVKSGRSIYFKLSSSLVYQKFFWEVLQRIQRLKLE